MTRRWFLSLALLVFAGCPESGGGGGGAGGPTSATPTSGKAELNVLIFSEYIDPALLKEFEAKHGAPVNLSFFESSEELLQKLQYAGGKSQFDLVIATNQLIQTLGRLALIQKLDHAKLKNLGNLAPRFKEASYDPGYAWSVPYQWGTVGLVYEKSKLAEPPGWSALFDPAKQPGSFYLIDEMRDQLGVALKSLGHSVNSTDPEQVKAAGQLLLQAKGSEKCKGFKAGLEGVKSVLGGNADLAVAWNGDAVKGIGESQGKLAFVLPPEGSIAWVDCMVIPSEAPRPDLAHAFIDFILEPEVGGKLSNFIKYATPNQAALPHVNEQDRNDPAIYPPEAALAKLEYLVDLGDKAKLYDEVWTAVKSR